MTLPAAQDFIVNKGTTFSELIEWRNEDGEIEDLATYTGQMDVRQKNGQLLITLSTDNDRIVPVAGGQARIALEAEETRELVAGTYEYDLFFWKPAGTVTALLTGSFMVRPTLTAILS